MVFYIKFLLDNTRREEIRVEQTGFSFLLRDLDEVKDLDILIPPAVFSQSASQPAPQQMDTSRANI